MSNHRTSSWIAAPVLIAALTVILASCAEPPFAEKDAAVASGARGFLGDECVQVGDLAVVNDQPFPDMYFDHYGVNPTIDTAEERFSTFSVDVDTASYSVARSYLKRGHLPPESAVRVEEFVNAFDYRYAAPRTETFQFLAEAAPAPHRPGYHLLHIGLKGREVEAAKRTPAHLAFVIDVSGSMDRENRLGAVKRGLRLLVDQLREGDRVGIVVYGARGRELLDLVDASERDRILEAIGALQPTGSTNAQEGIELGYRMLARHFDGPKHIHRIVLCSDGVANNGISTSAEGIFRTVQEEARKGITISTVGFGMGNYNDVLMERLAQIGDGNYAYCDSDAEARRVFVENLTAMLQVIAKDVKIQVEFDPAVVTRYRLLGYENRRLETEDFADDRKDAGEVGAGHEVTAIYEVKLTGAPGDLAVLRVRYKGPEGGASRLTETPLPQAVVRDSLAETSPPVALSAVVASFAEKLRGSYWVRRLGYGEILADLDALPGAIRGREEVAELRELILCAQRLDQRGDRFAAEVPPGEMDFDRVPVLAPRKTESSN